MLSSITTTFAAILALTSLTTAQTSTSCNPTNTTCPSDQALSSSTFSTDFTKGDNTSWSVAAYTTLEYSSDNGAAFTINTKADAPTIETDFYIFFGYVEVTMRAAPGTGIVSSAVLQSDDLDEIDWEFLGGTTTSVQTNFFGKGNTTTYNREADAAVSGSTTDEFHTYALNWTSSSLTWLIDGTVVRTLQYTDSIALNGKNYPQTPCRVKLGSWAGGASSSEGTVEWAGGATDFSKAPFTMYVKSVKIVNYNPGTSYSYSDKTGDFGSIKVSSNSSEASTSTTLSVAPVTSTKATGSATATASASTTGQADSNNSNKSGGSSSTISSSSSTATSESSFVQSANGANRQAEATILGSKISYLFLAAIGYYLVV